MQISYRILILTILSFTFCIEVTAQMPEPILKKATINLSLNDSTRDVNTIIPSKTLLSNIFFQNTSFQNSMLPANHYSANLGFFCKKELAREKITIIPVKIRLGSLNYCNQLEGKANY